MSEEEFFPKKTAWSRILLLIIPYFIIVGGSQLIIAWLVGINWEDKDQILSIFQELSLHFADIVGTFLLLWLFMRYIDRKKFIQLGFQKQRIKELLPGVFIGAIIMITAFFLLIALHEILLDSINFDLSSILCTIALYIIVAVVEETLFRGYILRNLMYSFSKYIALITSAFIFAAMHGFNPNMDWFTFTNLFLAGLFLGISYIYTKNLWFPIGLHLGWNLFQSLLGFNVSGQDFYAIVNLQEYSPNLLNGGDFGLEGSYLITIAEIIGVIGIGLYYHRNRKSIAFSPQ